MFYPMSECAYMFANVCLGIFERSSGKDYKYISTQFGVHPSQCERFVTSGKKKAFMTLANLPRSGR